MTLHIYSYVRRCTEPPVKKHVFVKLTFFFLHIQFIYFQTKSLQSPGTYISGRTWDPSEKAISKQLIEQLDACSFGVIFSSFLTGTHLLINKKDKNSRYTKIKIMII